MISTERKSCKSTKDVLIDEYKRNGIPIFIDYRRIMICKLVTKAVSLSYIVLHSTVHDADVMETKDKRSAGTRMSLGWLQQI